MIFPSHWIDDKLIFVDSENDVLNGSDALILITEWKLYRNPDFQKIKELLKYPIIFDGRNQYSPKLMKKLGFTYKGIGR